MSLADEPLMPLSQAARLVPSARADHAHPSALLRWVVDGRRVRGRVFRLEAVRVGASWFTSAEAVRRFTRALTDAALAGSDGGAKGPGAPGRPAVADRAEAARAVLAGMGFGRRRKRA